MALINCPECNKSISDKATNCPNCGFPLKTGNNKTQESENTELKCPTFPDDLAIGKQIVNWAGNAACSGYFRGEDNTIRTVTPGEVKVLLHKSGIRIVANFIIPQMDIHNSQLISIDFADQTQLLKQNKSVIGRAVVGNLLMGPMGAIIGGLSGTGSKSAKIDSFLVINFWDKFTKLAQTILIRGKDLEIRAFIGRWNTERSKIPSDAQNKAKENLNQLDKKILEICEQQGLEEAINFYITNKNIDFKLNPDAKISSRIYVENLAKTFSVKIKSSGCFIATSCFGDYNAPEVIILRQFRDQKLKKKFLGRIFINFYYFISPFIAKNISKSRFLTGLITRYILKPIVTNIRNEKIW